MKQILLCFVSGLLLYSCKPSGGKDIERVKQISDEVRQLYIPDKRVGIFDIECNVSGKQVTVKGETTSTSAREELINRITDAGYQTIDSICILPDRNELGEEIYGVVNLSVCNLHSEADFSSEMVTQAVLGMPVKILAYRNWYRVQTPDNYIAWVHRAGIQTMTKEAYNAWGASDKVIVTSHYGFTYEKPFENAQVVSDVVAGNRFCYEGEEGMFFKVVYPDGRRAFLSKSMAETEKAWRASLKQTPDDIIATAHTLMGVPYLWAGTSSKGMDCSGYVRNVLYMHDIIIPRDASQQAYVGERIEIEEEFQSWLPGDLIFFGRKATADSRERIVHVGIYIGNQRFIHSQGDVRVGSLNRQDEAFDEFNLNRLLFATRIWNFLGTAEINTTADNPYYRRQ